MIVNIDQSWPGKWTVRVFAIKGYGPQINPTATALQSYTCVGILYLRYPVTTLGTLVPIPTTTDTEKSTNHIG